MKRLRPTDFAGQSLGQSASAGSAWAGQALGMAERDRFRAWADTCLGSEDLGRAEEGLVRACAGQSLCRGRPGRV